MDLHAAYLGGSLDAGRMGESHEVVLVVATDRAEAKSRAKNRPAPPERLDALERIVRIVRIVRVDGHTITLNESLEENDEVEMDSFN